MKELADALRLSFLLPVEEDRPASSWGTILVLLAVSVVWPTLLALPYVGLAGEPSVHALGDALVHVPLILIASIAAALALGRKQDTPRIFAAGLLISIFVDLAQLAFSALAPGSWVLWAFPAWLVLALGTYAARQTGAGVRRLAAFVACLIILAPLASMYRERALWHKPFDPEAYGAGRSHGSAGSEAVIYRQPELLAQALDAIRPGRKGVIDVFFVAMGGYADQDVFRKEVDATSRLMAERFGAEGHSIRLINNHETLHDLPIASKTSLRASLNRVASVMDKDEDLLVLFMTSHGSKKHVFTLELAPLRFEDIDPASLRALLDESGIRNRVVIVSACYSGGFTKALEDANTLVITASAADRTSFGCSNEAEWTYFGKAYFDEALRSTHSFTRAFEMATPLIREREAKVRTEVSEPQLSLGAGLAPKLAALERQLDGVGSAADAAAVQVATVKSPGDKYVEYVDLLLAADYLEEIARTCRVNMEQRSPAATLRKRPDSFWGMDSSPQHWKRVTQAWETYAEQFCTRANDKALLRETYLQKARSVMREQEVDAALAFLRSQPGALWYRAEREVTRQQAHEMARRQSDLNERLYKDYLEAETAALDSFRKTRK